MDGIDDRYPGLRIVDAVTFVDECVMPGLTVGSRLDSLALHPTCSSTRLGTNDALARISAAHQHHHLLEVLEQVTRPRARRLISSAASAASVASPESAASSAWVRRRNSTIWRHVGQNSRDCALFEAPNCFG